LKIELILFPEYQFIPLYAHVVDCSKKMDDNLYRFNIAVDFVGIGESDQETIMQHILSRQAATIKKERMERLIKERSDRKKRREYSQLHNYTYAWFLNDKKFASVTYNTPLDKYDILIDEEEQVDNMYKIDMAYIKDNQGNVLAQVVIDKEIDMINLHLLTYLEDIKLGTKLIELSGALINDMLTIGEIIHSFKKNIVTDLPDNTQSYIGGVEDFDSRGVNFFDTMPKDYIPTYHKKWNGVRGNFVVFSNPNGIKKTRNIDTLTTSIISAEADVVTETTTITSLSATYDSLSARVTAVENTPLVTSKFVNLVMTEAKFIDNVITASKISDAEITNAKFVDATIDNAKFVNLTLTADKFVNATLTGTQFANTSMSFDKVNIDAAIILSGTHAMANLTTNNVDADSDLIYTLGDNGGGTIFRVNDLAFVPKFWVNTVSYMFTPFIGSFTASDLSLSSSVQDTVFRFDTASGGGKFHLYDGSADVFKIDDTGYATLMGNMVGSVEVITNTTVMSFTKFHTIYETSTSTGDIAISLPAVAETSANGTFIKCISFGAKTGTDNIIINHNGNANGWTSITLNTVGQSVMLISTPNGGTYKWSICMSNGVVIV